MWSPSDPDSTVTRNAEYYTLGHLARFVQPGAWRVASSSFGTTGWNGMVMDAAFLNPDGSTVLVVHNENDDPRTFAVAEGDRSFDYTLPGGALATFVWPAIGRGPTGTAARPDDGMSATASRGAPDGRPTRRRRRDDALDHQAAQTPGQWVQVDLGATQTRQPGRARHGRRHAATTRAGTRSRPAPMASTWTQQATGAGSGQLTTIDFPSTSARYVRITQTGSSGSWWSVADLRAYG